MCHVCVKQQKMVCSTPKGYTQRPFVYWPRLYMRISSNVYIPSFAGRLMFGTVDAWLLWNFTGEANRALAVAALSIMALC